jgi:hypothetical protein
MPKTKHSTRVPDSMQSYYQAITEMTDKFCQQALNDDYKTYVRYVTAALCRKRPSPLVRGKINTWAGSIVYALGSVNFLFDRSFEPYIGGNDLAAAFNISSSTAGNKAKQIRDMLKMDSWNHHWCLPGMMDDSPAAWMIMLGEVIIDARTLPQAVQRAAYEKGLIPYVHADKQ